MRVSAVALKVTRYSDSQSILTAFSRERGRLAFAIPAGRGRESSRIRALTMPLGIVECETDLRPGRDVLPMRQVRPLKVNADIHSNPLKQMTAMFVAEVLSATLQAGETDERTFDFVAAAAGYLDKAGPRETANFPICFLYRWGELLGVEPDVSTYNIGGMLDMRDGRWRMTAPLHGQCLSPRASEAAAMLSRMTFENMGAFRFRRGERAEITDAILQYYSIHIAPLGNLKTLPVLRSML